MEACLNVAVTYEGFSALQLPAESLASFPDEFVQGAVARAPIVGDVGASAPEHWKPALTQPGVHVLVLLFALTAAIRDRESARLTATWAAANALAPIAILQGEILPGEVAHFGYRDGFSQPTIDGGLPSLIADTLPPAPAGAFVFGYPSQFRDFTYPTPVPNEFGANGSFLALRVLEQDCAAEGDGCERWRLHGSVAHTDARHRGLE